MNRPRLIPLPYAYIRLSREEIDNPGSFAEKIERHRQIARDLAKRYDLDLPESNIIVELESGSSLRNRPELKRLLDLAHSGLLTHLIATAHDRIDRILDKREQADLEDALFAGEVTVITMDGANTYNEELDVLPVEFRALLARAERRNYSKRIKHHNRQRLAKNQRTSSYAPWGYKRNRQSESGYDIIPSEYAEVQLVFQRVLNGWSLRAIQADLNERQIPPPSVGRRKNCVASWGDSTLRDIVTNPFYAGYHARRTTPRRNGRPKAIPPSEYQLGGGEPGTWPQPITLAQWHEIISGYPRFTPTNQLLTRILHCPGGSHMTAAGNRQYGCYCNGTPAKSKHSVIRRTWDEFAKALVLEFIARIPDSLDVPPADAVDRSQLLKQLARATTDHKQRLDELQQFARSAAAPDSPLRHFDPETVRTMVKEMEVKEQAARRELERLRALASAPDAQQAISTLQIVKQAGSAVWEKWTIGERRAFLKSIVERIQIDATPGPNHRYRTGSVVWQQWVIDAGLSFDIPDSVNAQLKAIDPPELPRIRGRFTSRNDTQI